MSVFGEGLHNGPLQHIWEAYRLLPVGRCFFSNGNTRGVLARARSLAAVSTSPDPKRLPGSFTQRATSVTWFSHLLSHAMKPKPRRLVPARI